MVFGHRIRTEQGVIFDNIAPLVDGFRVPAPTVYGIRFTNNDGQTQRHRGAFLGIEQY